MIRIVPLVLLAISLAACASLTATPTGARTVAVTIERFQFLPATLDVTAGTTVVWTNKDDILHTVTSGTTSQSGLGAYASSPDGLINGPMDGAATQFRFTFERPGTYAYFCDRHRHMTATVVVR